jgi:hypothetical protein
MAQNGTSNLFFTLPPSVPISASFTLQRSAASNVPASVLYCNVLEGTGGMGALNGINFPQLTNALPILTTGTNVATILPAQSWMNFLGTNGVVPMGGELVAVITNEQYQGSNGLVVTLDVSGTYNFGTGEADWFTVSWNCYFPTITPTMVASAIAGGNISFLFQSIFQQTYAIQTAGSLQSTNWQPFTNIFGDGAVHQVVDSTTNAPQKFYRISSQ